MSQSLAGKVKRQLAYAVQLTNKGGKANFYFEQSFKDEEHGCLLLQSLLFDSDQLAGQDGKIAVPIPLKVCT